MPDTDQPAASLPPLAAAKRNHHVSRAGVRHLADRRSGRRRCYGFLVWMFQIIFGPPGPPAH
uniref:Periplasmic nitrate reductase subunit n=1 Tax=Rhizobium meliloti TaxID=382 RepID=Q5SF02_RHIML|nr:periplasmic nitrate reductase subunit [Sinorhizobium meliloti]